MNNKRNKGIKIGTFKREGHRSHTRWSSMSKQKGFQDLLDKNIKKLKLKYETKRKDNDV